MNNPRRNTSDAFRPPYRLAVALASVAALAFSAGLAAVSAQTSGGGQAIRIDRSALSSPTTVRGTGGGTVHATQHGTTEHGVCIGWIAARPNHRLVVAEALEAMTLAVRSPADTTLVVLGPDGARCSDDADGVHPRISGSWPAGEYRVFVGTYAEGESAPYELTIRR